MNDAQAMAVDRITQYLKWVASDQTSPPPSCYPALVRVWQSQRQPKRISIAGSLADTIKHQKEEQA